MIFAMFLGLIFLLHQWSLVCIGWIRIYAATDDGDVTDIILWWGNWR